MNKLFRTLVIAAPLVSLSAVAFGQAIFVPTPPPPLQREIPPPPPGVGVVWHPGFWRWDGRQYFWEPGRYVAPPPHRVRWVPGHWARQPNGYLWVEGRWR